MQLGKIKKFDILLWFTVLYIIVFTKITILGFGLLDIVILILWGITIYINNFNLKFCKSYFYLAYIAITLFGYFFHGNTITGFFKALELILVLLMIPRLIDSENKYWRMIDAILFVGGILAVLGLIETITGINVFEIIAGVETSSASNIYRFGLRRSQGFCNNFINYGAFLGMMSCLALYRITNQNKTKKSKTIIIYVLLILNMLSTLSRGVILIFGIIQLILWWKAGVLKRIDRVFKILGAIILIGVILQLLGVPVIDAINNIYYMIAVIFDSSYEASLSDSFGSNVGGIGNRLDLFGWIYDAVKDNLFFGMGYSSRFSVHLNGGFYKTSIENSYLAQLYYTGILGLTGLLFFLFGNIKKAISAKLKMTSEGAFRYESMFVWLTIGYMLAMFTFKVQSDFRLYYILAGLLYSRNIFLDKDKRLQNVHIPS